METPKTPNVFTINGKQYDANTGLLIGSPAQAQVSQSLQRLRQPAHHATNVHSHLQRSQTLRRRSVTKPAQTVSAQKPAPAPRPAPQRSPMIRRFADITPARSTTTAPARPATTQAAAPRVAPADRPFKTHPLAQKAAVRRTTESVSQSHAQSASLHSQPSSVIKQAMINEAMERTVANQQRSRTRRKKEARKSFRLASLASASLAVVLLGGYFSYLAMPNLSVRVAAVQSGVNASYPGYKPNGYRLDGPVAYTGGQVSMTFQANGGPQRFTLTQSNSNWDSTAVESNYVQPDVGDAYTVTKKQGLTIYTYSDGKAAWVNKGIFYTLQGDAPLSSDQIARIATSM